MAQVLGNLVTAGPGDSRIVPVIAGYSWEPGAETRTPSNTCRIVPMVRTRSASLAKGKAKLCHPPTRASLRLAALRSNIAVQIPTSTPDVPVKEAVASTLPPKTRQNFRMVGESSSRRDTRTPCRRSRRLAALCNVTKPVLEEKNDVYDALWAMLDAESDNEAVEMPREWDLDSTFLNWGKNEPDVGPAEPNQGPPPAEI
ncbi:hypothetical protein PIB30_021839 [Stylosanthes scabra]|uniref:Uncharacterized protein n=1 Tax=Stylosanthes scabra TaxID=79078 RepID=A0ABU6Y7M9_9FABA|nr:hypothetical protein [Stylosanthes scabra]